MIGRVLLHYQVTERLGAGGMGIVYRAVDLKLKRTVALKFLPAGEASSEESMQRFMREAMAASALDHVNIGTIYAIEEADDGQLFIAMSCYDGPTLRDRMRGVPMPPGKAIEITLQIAQGLAEAHRHGIIHRDIKPGNLIFNAQRVLKILDFGIARLHDSPDLTQQGSTLGTARYMAPEQAMGKPTDQRADLWSTGVVLYEMLSGQVPFAGPSASATIQAVLSEEPPPIVGLPGPLQKILTRALQKDPDQRYQRAEEMIVDLQAARGVEFQVVPNEEKAALSAILEPTSPLPVPQKRRQWKWIATAAVLVCVLAVSGVLGRTRFMRTRPSGSRIAILPLTVNSGEDASRMSPLQALATGLRVQLTNSLIDSERSNQNLTIIPASELGSQHVSDVASARTALGADIVLTGSFEQNGDHIRVALNSVHTADSNVFGSETLEGAMDALPALQQELVQTAAGLLGLKGATPVSSTDVAPAAMSAYLTSLGYLERWDKPGNLDAVSSALEQAIQASPNFAPAYAALANCDRLHFAMTKDSHYLVSAEKNIDRAIQLNPQLPEVVLARGQLRVAQGRYPEALSDFQNTLAVDASNDSALRGMAKAYGSMGLPDKAEDVWQQAIAARPKAFESYNQLGIFHFGQGNYGKAIEEFKKALLLVPDNAAILTNLGVAQLYAGSLGESRAALEHSIRLTPTYEAYNNLGNLDVKQGRYSDAANDYEKALELNKTDYRTWANMATAYSHIKGNEDRAKDGYLRAADMAREQLKVNPNDPVILSDLATFVASEGSERQEPLVLIEKALALAPQDPYVQFNAAETYEAIGYRKEALDWLSKAIAAGYPLDDIEESSVLSDLVKDPRFQKMTQKKKT